MKEKIPENITCYFSPIDITSGMINKGVEFKGMHILKQSITILYIQFEGRNIFCILINDLLNCVIFRCFKELSFHV